jgi:hypothetical protein
MDLRNQSEGTNIQMIFRQARSPTKKNAAREEQRQLHRVNAGCQNVTG